MRFIDSYFDFFGLECQKSGVKIIINKNIPSFIENRIVLSDGLENGQSIAVEKYAVNSFVPKLPWRIPTINEMNFLYSEIKDGQDYSTYIGVIKFKPNQCRNLLKAYHKSLYIKDYFQEYDKIAKSILEDPEYFPTFSYSGNVELAGLAIQENGLITVSIDNRTNKIVGLHVDYWDNLPLNERAKSSNRISINLSSETRYLLFINLTLAEMKDVLKLDDNEQPFRVCFLFMNTYPFYPVVRLAIRPYEAYVAPTENIIHDGSSLGMSTMSLCYNYRGYFSVI